MVLSQLIYTICSDRIAFPLSPSIQSSQENINFVKSFSSNILLSGFPHLHPSQVKIFVDGLFDLNSDVDIFSMHVKDFLVSLRELSGTTDFSVELEAELERKRRVEEERIKKIPGMLKPSDIVDADSDIDA